MKKYLILLIAILLGVPSLLYGQSDLVDVKPPNAMIIFDSSSSMNSKTDGTGASASSVKVDKDGNVFPIGTAPWTSYNFEGGGNHPSSKLYQAKQIIKEVIKAIEEINFGFATYGQGKTELRRGYYVRGRQDCTGGTSFVAGYWQYTKLYWRFNNYTHPYQTTSNKLDKSIGDTYTEVNHWFTNSPANNGKPVSHNVNDYKKDLVYTIYAITLNAESNVYTYYYASTAHDHYEETTRVITDPLDGTKNCDTIFTKPWGGPPAYTTYDEGTSPNPKVKWNCKVTWIPSSGPTACSFGAKYNEYGWLQYDNTVPGYPNCPATWGSDNNWNPVGNPPAKANAWTKWTIVDPTTLNIPPAPAAAWSVKATKTNCYDASTYSYPAVGSASKPDTWSYYKDVSGNWSNKPNPYYPSRDKDVGGTINDTPGTFNNHYLFINIPQVDDSTNGYANRNAIVDLLDLNPVLSPETGKYHTKLPVKTLDLDPKKRNSLTSSEDTPVRQTPLYAALKDSYDYFDSYTKWDALSAAGCRGNTVILITDGLESCKYIDALHPDFGAAATIADQMNTNLKVKTFVIGFGSAAGTNKSSLDDIARKGGTCRGEPDCAYFAATKDELQAALLTIIEVIKADKVGRSTPVVTRNRDRLYRGYFNYSGYAGHLMAYELNTDGSIKGEVQWDAGASSGKGGDAGWVMKNIGRGNVYTWIANVLNPARQDFDYQIINAQALDSFVNPLGEDINGGGGVNWKDARTVIRYVLDPNYDDIEDGEGIHAACYHKGKRRCDWLLGDIYHSSPLIVADPPLNFPDIPAFTSKYSDFKTTWKNNRETIIYVGANDGMLHGIKDSDGTEKFAIIPKNLLGKLKDLQDTHQFFVDSSPRAYDVFFGGAWRTIIVTGERGGGNYYFAVDVTDPSNPKMLWEWTDPDGRLGFTWSRPEIGWVKISGQEKFVAFVGGGYTDPSKSINDNIGNTFYVVDIEKGTKLATFDVGNKTNRIPAGATAFDSDMDGRINNVYFGDINGTLWKIKIEGEEEITKWQLINLYTPTTNTPVFYPPAVTKNNQGRIMVYYGQGSELNLFEQLSSNSFYEIEDKGDSGQMIWEEKLQKGEKVLAAPAVANNVVYFTSWLFTGTSGDCGAGKGRLYGLTTTSLGVKGDMGALILDPLTGKDTGVSKKYIEITDYFPTSTGIPSAPIVTNGMIYISTSLNADQVINIPIPAWGTGKLKYWREVF
jgi:hypothetical protein